MTNDPTECKTLRAVRWRSVVDITNVSSAPIGHLQWGNGRDRNGLTVLTAQIENDRLQVRSSSLFLSFKFYFLFYPFLFQ